MTYNPNIPQGTDNISSSQAQIQTNFNQVNVQYGQDHVAFNTGSGNGTGFHKKVTLPDNPAAIVTTAGQWVMYGRNTTGITMPYYKRDGAPTIFPVSPIKAYISGTFLTASTASIQDSFNITLTSVVTSGNLISITLGITQPMRTNTYGVLLSTGGIDVGLPMYYTARSTSSVIINLLGAPLPAFNFTAILIET